ncbi:MAG TPA: hypothetical protein VM659_01650 [Dongiaceae bacterium]|nr:hypothetical protein [Dongiaceae bacterium]
MGQIDTSQPKHAPHGVTSRGVTSQRQTLRPEQISVQGIPAMAAVLREIGLCVAIALGLALLASIYVHVKGG